MSQIYSPRTKKNCNLKISSGAYRESFVDRLSAYHLSPKNGKNDVIGRMKNAYESEIRYMNEYICVLKNKSGMGRNEEVLREEITGLFELLKKEQKVNLELMERLENGRFGREKDFDGVKKKVFERVDEEFEGFGREIRKMQEKLERIDLCYDRVKREEIVLRQIVGSKGKNEFETEVEIVEKTKAIEKLEKENMRLNGIVKELKEDIRFYQGENEKQREIIRDFNEIDNQIREQKGFLMEIPRNEKKILEKCESCESFEKKIKTLSENTEKIEEENKKLKKELEKILEDNQNLEIIVEKMQDLLVLKQDQPLGHEFCIDKDLEKEKLLEKVKRLQDSLDFARKENIALQENYKSKCEEVQETYKSSDFTEESALNYEILKKEYNFAMVKTETLMDLKGRFIELIHLIREKCMLEEEISKKSSKNHSHYQIITELAKKNTRINEIISCFASLS